MALWGSSTERGSMLEQMTHRLLSQRTFEAAAETLLNDVVALHGAEYGDLQLMIGNELVVVAQRGLSAAFLQAFRRVRRDDGCACGRVLGMVSTMFANVHEPTPIELQTLMYYSRIAADYLAKLLTGETMAAKAEQM